MGMAPANQEVAAINADKRAEVMQELRERFQGSAGNYSTRRSHL
ncbi:MAG: hypothetical protein ACXWEU_02965 [Methylomonas sp.]